MSDTKITLAMAASGINALSLLDVRELAQRIEDTRDKLGGIVDVNVLVTVVGDLLGSRIAYTAETTKVPEARPITPVSLPNIPRPAPELKAGQDAVDRALRI